MFYKSTLLFAVLILVLVSCSRKRDSFINRNYHALTAQYNALYNGSVAFETGRTNLDTDYQDNYWEILPIEPMTIKEVAVTLGDVSENENFSRAEEKATKAIQKHAMDIDGRERNPKIDDAYLLLGKARYFDQRFVPAIEAFNYILYRYPASNKINEAKVWREKTNLRLENYQLALENLKRLLENEVLKQQDLADATATLADTYLRMKYVDSAIAPLKIAAANTKRPEQRARYRFIQGQLYDKLGYQDSARTAFDQVLAMRRKIPRVYWMSAYLEKIKHLDYAQVNRDSLEKEFTKLERNYENKPFFNRIFHQIGTYYTAIGADSLAVVYYNKSLRAPNDDSRLKAINYQTLGTINFDTFKYIRASKYYDSTMTNLEKNSKLYRTIKKKRDNLESVIHYESLAKTNDSILYLVQLSDTERLQFFSTYTDSLKQSHEAQKALAEAKERQRNATGISNPNRVRQPAGGDASSFYFYNPSTVAYGKNEFVKIWGQRSLQDNWRWTNKQTAGSNDLTPKTTAQETLKLSAQYDPLSYIAKIPKEPLVIDSIAKVRNNAYYQLGLIYKEKYKAYKLAENKFENLLNNITPDNHFVKPSKYNLYKIYTLLGQNTQAEFLKKDIITNYPNSPYASILKNPEALNLDVKNSPREKYDSLYKHYENQDYKTVIQQSEVYTKVFEGDPIAPKFELLKAVSTGRLYGYDAYIEALKFVELNYSNTPEGAKAETLITDTQEQWKSASFEPSNDSIPERFKVVFEFKSQPATPAKTLKKTLDTLLKKHRHRTLKTSLDVYTSDTSFVLIHGFKSKRAAETFEYLFPKEDRLKIRHPYFVISSKNYQTLQIHKNLEAYLENK